MGLSSITTTYKNKGQQSRRKIMVTIFWDYAGIMMVDFKEYGTADKFKYYATLLEQLEVAIDNKRPGQLRREVSLIHDIVPVHSAVVAKASMAKNFKRYYFHFIVREWPPATTTCFGTLKRSCGGGHFRKTVRSLKRFLTSLATNFQTTIIFVLCQIIEDLKIVLILDEVILKKILRNQIHIFYRYWS